jgi:hypothetical protein
MHVSPINQPNRQTVRDVGRRTWKARRSTRKTSTMATCEPPSHSVGGESLDRSACLTNRGLRAQAPVNLSTFVQWELSLPQPSTQLPLRCACDPVLAPPSQFVCPIRYPYLVCPVASAVPAPSHSSEPASSYWTLSRLSKVAKWQSGKEDVRGDWALWPHRSLRPTPLCLLTDLLSGSLYSTGHAAPHSQLSCLIPGLVTDGAGAKQQRARARVTYMSPDSLGMGCSGIARIESNRMV